MPAPSDVVALTQPGKPLVFLNWTPLSDPRVAGYRVERTDADGNVEAIGSTLTAGFADITAQFNRTYTYAVFGYTAGGVDSAPGDGLTVTIDPFRVYLPVIFK